MAIDEGLDIDPQLHADPDASIEKFERSVEAEKIAIRNVEIATTRMNRSANALRAANARQDNGPGH